jgi:hypothetical protein
VGDRASLRIAGAPHHSPAPLFAVLPAVLNQLAN